MSKRQANVQKEQLGLYMKNWRRAEERDAALVSEKTEVRGGAPPFGEVFAQMPGSGNAGCRCRCLEDV